MCICICAYDPHSFLNRIQLFGLQWQFIKNRQRLIGLYSDKSPVSPRTMIFFLHHGITPRLMLQSHKRAKKFWLRTPVENLSFLIRNVGRCVLEYMQERKGELKELLASNLKKHQKTAKNIIVNNIVTLTSSLLFDKSSPPSQGDGRIF